MASLTPVPPSTSFLNEFTIMVVDDDATSLEIISEMLKQCHYQVVMAEGPYDALTILRARRDIDLVISNLYMTEMGGLQLKQHIDEEFKLPFIIMSEDDEENVISECLASGVMFFITKPVNQEDVKGIWQHAFTYKKGKSPIVDEIDIFGYGESEGESFLMNNNSPFSDGHNPSPPRGATSSSASTNNNNDETLTRKRKYIIETGKKIDDNELYNQNLPTPKKPKVVWTSSLHYRFLLAIKHIGMDRAVPKKILECMNVPGLTRENIASHLQKYRIFLRKVAELGLYPASNLTERALRSTFATTHCMMLQQEQFLAFMEQQNHMRGLNLPYRQFGGRNTSSFRQPLYPPTDFTTLRFPGQGASGNNVDSDATRPYGQNYGYGQSSLLFNHGGRNLGNNFGLNGGMSSRMLNNGLNIGMNNGANFPQGNMYPQVGNQDLYNVGNGYYNGFIDSSTQHQVGASSFSQSGNTFCGTHNGNMMFNNEGFGSTSGANNAFSGTHNGNMMSSNGGLGSTSGANNVFLGTHDGNTMFNNGGFGSTSGANNAFLGTHNENMMYNNGGLGSTFGANSAFLGTHNENMMFNNGGLGLNEPLQFTADSGGYDYDNGTVNVAPEMPMSVDGTFGFAAFNQAPNQVPPSMAMPPLEASNHQTNTSTLPQVPYQGEVEFNFDSFMENSTFDDNINIDNIFDSYANLPSIPQNQAQGALETNGTSGNYNISPVAEYNPMVDMENANQTHNIVNNGEVNNINPSNNVSENQAHNLVNNGEVNNINPSNNVSENQVSVDDFINMLEFEL